MQQYQRRLLQFWLNESDEGGATEHSNKDEPLNTATQALHLAWLLHTTHFSLNFSAPNALTCTNNSTVRSNIEAQNGTKRQVVDTKFRVHSHWCHRSGNDVGVHMTSTYSLLSQIFLSKCRELWEEQFPFAPPTTQYREVWVGLLPFAPPTTRCRELWVGLFPLAPPTISCTQEEMSSGFNRVDSTCPYPLATRYRPWQAHSWMRALKSELS